MSEVTVEPAAAIPVWQSSVNPWIIAAAVMLATFLEVLDTSVANVALPHIAGDLSAGTDESTWVLTSYLVSNAIVLPMTGWLSVMFGRKRLLITCIFLFTLASAGCGMATSLSWLILARVIQGAAGGALQPLSQAILLENFPPAKRGIAMAVFGMGVVVAPIVGPTLGGWLTDNYSWRWAFYINLPLGVLAIMLCQAFLEDPPYVRAGHRQRARSIDYIGFGTMAIWLATLQIILDRGQQDDWFNATWICWASAISLVAMCFFIYWEFRVAHPLVNLRVLGNRNFAVGTMLIGIVGIVLYSTIALLPLFLQNLMGYPALNSGLALSPRGFGSIVAMLIVGRLVGKIDTRLLIALGFGLLTYSCWLLGNINLQIASMNVTWPNILSGAALGFVFVPLTTVTMGDLPNEQMGNATGIFNLMRNLGGSFGISMATTLLARSSQVHQTMMSSHLTPYDPQVQQHLQSAISTFSQGGDPVAAHSQALGMLYGTLVRQAALWSYVDAFRFLAFLCLACIPLVLLLKNVRRGRPVAAH